MITNEKGMVIPLVLAITLITASLLITLASRLEMQARSYDQRMVFQKITLLEKESITLILDMLADPDFSLPNFSSSGTLSLSDGTDVSLNYYNGIASIAINYNFHYDDYLVRGGLTYDKRQHTYTLN